MGLRTIMKLERRIEEDRTKTLGWGEGNKIVMWFREKKYRNEGKRKRQKIGGEVEEKNKDKLGTEKTMKKEE